MLLAAQKEHGYVTNEDDRVHRQVPGPLNPSEVDSILSFYTLLRRRPVGKYHILICTNLSCMLRGSDEIEACVKRKLGVDLGTGHAGRAVFGDRIRMPGILHHRARHAGQWRVLRKPRRPENEEHPRRFAERR